MHTVTTQDIRPTWAQRTAPSGSQFQLISDMAKERGIDVANIFRRPENVEEAKTIINWLRAQPIPAPASAPQVPNYEGIAPKAKPGKRAQAYHYAIEDAADGIIKFYRVKAGRKEGFYFVDVQASDDYYPIKNYGHKMAILDAINADREGALALYGREIGRCGRCNRTLTSEYRKLGIGPVCIDK